MRGSLFRHWALLGALALLCVFALSEVPASHAVAGTSKPASWIELGGGSHGDFLWSIKARSRGGPSGEGSLGAQRPCLLVAASWQPSQLEFHRSTYRECATTWPLSRSAPPLLASAVQPSTGAPAGMSAVGMIFAPAVRRVRVTLAGGRTKTIRLRDFDPAQAGAQGPGRLRYAAFAIHGTWCAERLISLSESGNTLWDSGIDDYQCGAGEPPKFAGRLP